MRPAPPAISVTIETYAPGEWHYTARLYGRPVGDNDGEPLAMFALAAKAAMTEIQSAMAERSASVSDSLPISDSLPAEVERDHE